MSMEIDWSKAPEGATHYQKSDDDYFPAWIKANADGTLEAILDNGMDYKWVRAGLLKDKESFLIARPTAWNGIGLPPVGTVCEYNLTAGPWYVCEIRYVLDNDKDPDADGWTAVIWCPHLEKEQIARAGGMSFRPIRTPEQIAAEEREKAVAEMLDHFRLGSDKQELLRAIFFALHDAGYRKQEPKP